MSTRDRSQGAASERAYRWTKERILDGRFEGGRLISEGEVAEDVGLSRTPVREAFLRLSAEGLLRLYPKKGALVVPVSASEAEDIAEARIFLERHAAAKVIGAGRQREVVAEMRRVLAEQKSLEWPDPRFTTLDREFHAALVHAAGNALFDEFYSGLRDRQLRMVHTALRHANGDRPRIILEEHTRICDLLEAGDGDALHDLISAHIRTVASRIEAD
ncbi:DNA-binding GntR family transcriptional regulator [Amycolatopsis bartoniae]|uniref:GntR family transcriptional regulator n=1 Tax=Amycolatopsis bartoniae TaxID=941986 RepID=A0A8H9J551_9PSEU|nr:GntR family transcriptional regulator [Amycolatopsis bartoniae]MBB2937375.1 DNA-binding GntR family transcriptional regulator [Amycolatopsis bartoniae]TVT01619.1 GntR family transcriptional regulator [Amycolatopsis bartoniae]GHF78540.1 GntR family transcriptional regulator [Amycolatopsis bartoniae]